MNVLEITDDSDRLQSQNCKAYYLRQQNQLMKNQYQTMTAIVKIYKSVLDLVVNSQETVDEEESSADSESAKKRERNILQLLNQSGRVIEEWEKKWCEFEKKEKEMEEEPSISTEFFMQMVLSYEKSISNIKKQIHQREILLQELENDLTHPFKNKENNYENSVVIKSIQSYDIYNRLADRCRHQIVELKLKKKKLQNSNIQKLYGFKLNEDKNGEAENDRTVKKVGELQKKSRCMLPEDKASIFEKAVILYKKKKLFNQIRQSKLIALKKKIKEKQYCNELLKQKLEDENWDKLMEMDYLNKHDALEQMVSFSLCNQSEMSNYSDFSVDLSRVLPENFSRKKNYAEYKAESQGKK